jgi:adenylate cyclase
MSDHADRAVTTAIEMRKTFAAFNQEETVARLPTLEVGIGIASGPVIAGNVGGKERIEYTVMGDAVNLAARLEDKTKDTGFPILFSDETYQALNEIPDGCARSLTDVQIKGKRDRVTVYTLSDYNEKSGAGYPDPDASECASLSSIRFRGYKNSGSEH